MTSRTAAALADDPPVQPDRWVRSMTRPVPTGVDRIDTGVDSTGSINGVDTRVDADVAVLDSGALRRARPAAPGHPPPAGSTTSAF